MPARPLSGGLGRRIPKGRLGKAYGVLAVLGACLAAGSAHACVFTGDQGNHNFKFANDAFIGIDNQFTSGLAGGVSQAVQSRARDMKYQRLGGRFAEALLPQGEGWCYRHDQVMGQNLQTPEDLADARLNPNDLPYAGMLAWQNAWSAINEEDFVGMGWMLGWVGSAALGEQLQRSIHKVNGATDPRGWGHQLSNEPLVNYYYTRKKKFIQRSTFDGSVAVDLALGNFFTLAELGLELRAGDRPAGFSPLFGPVGRRLLANPALHITGQHYLYMSFAVRVIALAFALPRDGNLFRKDNRWTEASKLSPKHVLGRVEAGVHWVGRRWAGHMQFWVSSRVADRIAADVSPFANSFGVLTIERRFGAGD